MGTKTASSTRMLLLLLPLPLALLQWTLRAEIKVVLLLHASQLLRLRLPQEVAHHRTDGTLLLHFRNGDENERRTAIKQNHRAHTGMTRSVGGALSALEQRVVFSHRGAQANSTETHTNTHTRSHKYADARGGTPVVVMRT